MPQASKDSAPRAEPTLDPRSTITPATSPESAAPASLGGRIKHDERGNAIWTPAEGTNRIAIGSTSRMLKQLDVADLRLEEDALPAKEAGEKPRGSGYGPGYNPYDRTAPVRKPPSKKKSGS